MATLEGYAKLAEHISRIPEHGMVRTFNALHLRSILYLQAELVKLEAEPS